MPRALVRRALVEGWLAGDLLWRTLCQLLILGGTLVLLGMKWLLDRLVGRPVSAVCWMAALPGSCKSVHERVGIRPRLRVLDAFVEWWQPVLAAWEGPPVLRELFALGGCLRVVGARVRCFGHILRRVG